MSLLEAGGRNRIITKTHLLIVDPQNDFCDPEQGALFVPGADQDLRRLAALIRCVGHRIHAIHVTLDSHDAIHVAHPSYWRDPSGTHPSPFTVITANDVREGRWLPVCSRWLNETRANFGALDYVEALEAKGRAPLCIWPPHCLIGSWGHNVTPPLVEALHDWEVTSRMTVNYVTKGTNFHTEHYSAIHADVPDPEDPGTQTNTALLDALSGADEILLAGEAASHCLANTALDADACLDDPSFARKLILLSDATSCIAGFELPYRRFVETLTAKGMRVMSTVEYSGSNANSQIQQTE